MSRQPDAHESYAVAAGILHWAAAILALSLLAIVLLVYMWAHPQLTSGVPPVRPVPPQPRLQPNPAADISAERSLQRSRLDGYLWMDKQHTVARIPIQRAMVLVASGASATPARSGSAPARPGAERPKAPAAGKHPPGSPPTEPKR